MSGANVHPITIMLTVRDMKRSIGFYRDTLGFSLDTTWPDADHPLYASLHLDRQAVMLHPRMSAEEGARFCGDDPAGLERIKALAEELKSNKVGVGVVTYLEVKDVDAFHAQITKKGVTAPAPKTQFYGQRDFEIQDPDGFRFFFYAPVKLESCQSCGMPLAEAKPGQMYCGYCSDDAGKLKPYEVVLEGTIQGYFMGMKKMPRKEAETAAREHLSKLPAWVARS